MFAFGASPQHKRADINIQRLKAHAIFQLNDYLSLHLAILRERHGHNTEITHRIVQLPHAEAADIQFDAGYGNSQRTYLPFLIKEGYLFYSITLFVPSSEAEDYLPTPKAIAHSFEFFERCELVDRRQCHWNPIEDSGGQ